MRFSLLTALTLFLLTILVDLLLMISKILVWISKGIHWIILWIANELPRATTDVVDR